MTGVTPITRKTKQVYQIAFSFMGVECREVLPGPHSRSAENHAVRLRAEILGKIARGDFRYTDHFPNSKRAAIFGHGSTPRDTLKQRLEAYRDRVKATLEPSTFDGYRKAIDNILVPAFGHLRLNALKPVHIREFVSGKALTLKRIRNILIPLRNVIAEALADEEVEFDPFDRVDVARLVPVEKRTSDFDPQPYTEAELRVLLGKLAGAERWTFQLWAYTGVRTGELIGLRWPRVDLEAGTISITETTTARRDKARPKTKAGVRSFPLLPAAREAIDGLRALTQLAGDRVTVNERSTRKDRAWDDKTLAKVWKKAHAGTGIAYRNPYQLRHTWASNLLSQGANAAKIAKLLGHETIEITIRSYAHWVDQGASLGFAPPPVRYGQAPLWAQEATGT